MGSPSITLCGTQWRHHGNPAPALCLGTGKGHSPVLTEHKTCPEGYILDRTAPRTSSGTGHQAHSGDDNAHFGNQEPATVSQCQCSGSHGACLRAFLLCWNLCCGLAWLLGQGQLHRLPAVAVLDTHSDGSQQVDHGQQGEVAKIHIKLQKRRKGRTALGAFPSSRNIQGPCPSQVAPHPYLGTYG